MSSSNSPLSNASNDANRNMTSSPAGSSAPSCGDAPPAPDQPVSPNKTHWIAIEFADEQGFPMAGEDYRVVLPDGTVVEDSLDDKGCAKITGIDSGSCRVSFPQRDAKDWNRV